MITLQIIMGAFIVGFIVGYFGCWKKHEEEVMNSKEEPVLKLPAAHLKSPRGDSYFMSQKAAQEFKKHFKEEPPKPPEYIHPLAFDTLSPFGSFMMRMGPEDKSKWTSTEGRA